ncbi:pyrroloquinoline quinone biosynthesis protein PqqE [Paraburkholderia caballeronis]|uniref:PqqA peptide cyclase n=1 Tax=Paraburkholderia caballeronis TaxID=416943 RepID=A0A1H7LKT4_9BURK|nr:pyrroloquinoline quinone biosynthesis protein PqqE [Paraburkholderia caballeronis]PXW28505.1 pyrroloquinoline quinone biosynthesis protein E [Paraburkholderia caballeronis]PXX03871.1 pyrroloquinoline quinone biosynthesis protein E [Paraburkholderia caballeronis]RAK04615.1 pyrroloquinoline quinone biosynthesis protein E [Paraburkholderia caballeronis]SED72671.1 pyrroloquinoline quinone biosynthesis protein E [Paraburkholderia caballeronis]SEK99560.1 pyrroloquinoline quinone biosynthesis prot
MTDLSTPVSPQAQPAAGASGAPQVAPPLWLLAELTYRCPLHCVFCYNPVDYTAHRDELDTAQWVKVLREARAIGAVQLGFSGGEPLLRDDLEQLVDEGHRLGFYTNLITSGVGLTDARLGALKEAGLDHIQLSFQDSTQELNDFLSSTRTFDLKKRVADSIKRHGFPMVLNCVLHRYNLPHVEKIIDMALALGAEYLELANTQYYGWAHANRDQLLPTREQLEHAEAVVERYRRTHGNQCRIFFVVPDYFENRPKACMNGWGSVFLGVAPDGAALPCHTARSLPGLTFPNVKDTPVRDIWYDSDAFNRFRGYAWMKEPCRSCGERTRDFGGCRCQAYLLTGDAANTDPVCDLSPLHEQVVDVVRRAAAAADVREQPIVFRNDANSRRFASGKGGPQ